MILKKKYIPIILFLLCAALAYAQDERMPIKSQPFNEETWRNAKNNIKGYAKNSSNSGGSAGKNGNGNSPGNGSENGSGSGSENGNNLGNGGGNGNSSENGNGSENGQQGNMKRYTDEMPKEQPNRNEKSESKPSSKTEENPPPKTTDGVATTGLLKLLLIVLGIGLIGWLIYYFMGGLAKKDTKITEDTEDLQSSLTNMEENLPMADVETPLEKAIRMGEYKLATRMYFLLIIQRLAAKSIIKWRKDKTNREYLREVRKQTYLPQFMSAVLAYEKAWFGLGEITKEEFELNRVVFEQLKNTI